MFSDSGENDRVIAPSAPEWIGLRDVVGLASDSPYFAPGQLARLIAFWSRSGAKFETHLPHLHILKDQERLGIQHSGH